MVGVGDAGDGDGEDEHDAATDDGTNDSTSAPPSTIWVEGITSNFGPNFFQTKHKMCTASIARYN